MLGFLITIPHVYTHANAGDDVRTSWCCRWRLTMCDRCRSRSIMEEMEEGISLNATEIYRCLIPSRSPRSKATDGIRMPSPTFKGIQTLRKSSNTRFFRSFQRSHACKHGVNVIDGIRRCVSTVVFGISLNATEVVPSSAFKCHRWRLNARWLSMAFEAQVHVNVCDDINAALISNCWP